MPRYVLAAAVVALALLTSAGYGADPVALPKKQDFKIFLLIGQSNMAGRGKPLAAEDTTAHPRVFVLDQKEAWLPAVDPLHFDKPAVVGVGLGLTFAKQVADAENITIGLVPAAVGGTEISAWTKGGRQYLGAVARAKRALQDGTLAGILWHQGESDSKPEKAAAYREKLDQVVEDFRAELKSPDVPFIVGTLSDSAAGAGAAQVNAALKTLPDRMPRTGCVLAEGLKMSPDNVHFAAASYRELGRRYAAQWLRVITSSERK